jgi:putative alpha-1,2-mannosidase
MTSINVTRNLIGTQYESGALISYQGMPTEIILRVGISFVSVEQACANAEEEVGDASFEDIVARSKALWNEKLSRVEVDLANTPVNVTEMLYTSLYRSFLTPVCFLTLKLPFSVLMVHRTMQQARLKLSSRAQRTLTSTPCE